MNQHTLFKIMELFWLAVAVIMALIGIWMLINGNFDGARIPLFGACAAGVMYWLRRYQRKRSNPNN